MPRAVHDELAAFARAWGERGVRAWGEGWWEMAAETGDLLARCSASSPARSPCTRTSSVAAAIFLSCHRLSGGAQPIVYTELNFPNVMYLMEGETAEGGGDRDRPLGRRHRRPHRAAAGGHRRADAAGADLPHPVPQRLRAGRRGDRPPLPRGGGDPAAGRLPVDRGGAAGAGGLGGARGHGRLGEVALRRPGRGLSLGEPGDRRARCSPPSSAGRRTRSPSPSAPDRSATAPSRPGAS